MSFGSRKVHRIGLLGGDGSSTPPLTADTLLLHCNGADGSVVIVDDGILGLATS